MERRKRFDELTQFIRREAVEDMIVIGAADPVIGICLKNIAEANSMFEDGLIQKEEFETRRSELLTWIRKQAPAMSVFMENSGLDESDLHRAVLSVATELDLKLCNDIS
jgi:hypothetical protein